MTITDEIIVLLAQGLKVTRVAAKLNMTRAEVWRRIYQLQRESGCATLYQLMWATGLAAARYKPVPKPRNRAQYLRQWRERQKKSSNSS